MADRSSVGRERVADLWAASGAQWLTDARVPVPVSVVGAVLDLVAGLDARGAGIATLVGAGGLGVLGERAASLGLGHAGTASAGGATRLLRSADGWVAVSLARPDDLELLSAWIDLALPDGRTLDESAWDAVARRVRSRSGPELVERATLLGLPCAVVGETPPGPAVVRTDLGAAPARPLAGLVVANLASLWAGPLAADVLTRLGARVLTVESRSRPDGSRATPAFFEALHHRTESVALALDTHAGRRQLGDLLARVDVVVEGSRPRALAQMGLDAAALATSGPQVWASITAHGRTGDAANRVGYGDDAAAAGGLVGWVGGEPRFLADAIADPVTGLTVAYEVVQALEHGGRWLLDVALARVSAAVAPRDAGDWTPLRTEPSRPRHRTEPGRSLPLGRDTARVLSDFGIAT